MPLPSICIVIVFAWGTIPHLNMIWEIFEGRNTCKFHRCHHWQAISTQQLQTKTLTNIFIRMSDIWAIWKRSSEVFLFHLMDTLSLVLLPPSCPSPGLLFSSSPSLSTSLRARFYKWICLKWSISPPFHRSLNIPSENLHNCFERDHVMETKSLARRYCKLVSSPTHSHLFSSNLWKALKVIYPMPRCPPV